MDDYTRKKLNGYIDNLGRMTRLDDETFLKQMKDEKVAESRFYAGFVAANGNGGKLQPLKDYDKRLNNVGRTEVMKDPLDYSYTFLDNIVTPYVVDLSNWDSIMQAVRGLSSEMDSYEKSSNMETQPTRKATARTLKLLVRLVVLVMMTAIRENTTIMPELVVNYAIEHHYLERIQRIRKDYHRDMADLKDNDSEAIRERMLALVGEDQ